MQMHASIDTDSKKGTDVETKTERRDESECQTGKGREGVNARI